MAQTTLPPSLSPAPLPSRRLNPVQWMLILVGIAVLGAGVYRLDVTTVLGGAILLALTAACMRRFQSAFLLLLGASMGISHTTLIDFRPTFDQSVLPVNLLDFLSVLMLISIIMNLIGRRDDFSLPRTLKQPYFLFTVMVIFGLGYGVYANSGSIPTYLRDVRLLITLTLSIVGTAWFIRKPEQLRQIAGVLVLAGLVCAAQQLVRLALSGGGTFNDVRDIGLPSPVLPMSIMFLVLYRYHGIPLGPRNAFPFLLMILLLAILVSFTRSVWAAIILSYIVGIYYMGAKQRAKALVIAAAAFGLLVFVVPFVLDLAAHGMDIQQLVQERFQQIMGQNDLARQARVAVTVDAWFQFIKSPVWGYGFGFPIYVYEVESRQMIETEFLHNSALFWGIKIGGIGLLGFIWMIFASFRRSLRAAASDAPEETPEKREVKAFAQAFIASMIPFVAIVPWSGGLNYIAFMPIMGLLFGLNWDKIARFADSRTASLKEKKGVSSKFAPAIAPTADI